MAKKKTLPKRAKGEPMKQKPKTDKPVKQTGGILGKTPMPANGMNPPPAPRGFKGRAGSAAVAAAKSNPFAGKKKKSKKRA